MTEYGDGRSELRESEELAEPIIRCFEEELGLGSSDSARGFRYMVGEDRGWDELKGDPDDTMARVRERAALHWDYVAILSHALVERRELLGGPAQDIVGLKDLAAFADAEADRFRDGQEPDWIDKDGGYWLFHSAETANKFVAAGLEVCGRDSPPPRNTATGREIDGPPGSPPSAPPSSGSEPMPDHHETIGKQFSVNAAEVFRTDQDRRERDTAEVIDQFEKTANAKDTPAAAVYRNDQQELGDKITNEPDPAQRQTLRDEKEARMHCYAGGLADYIGKQREFEGDREGAAEMRKYAGTSREIAAELRKPPEGPDRGPDEDKRERFAEAAREAAKEVLGRTAETVMVADGPQPTRPLGVDQAAASGGRADEAHEQPDGDKARQNAQFRAEIRPEVGLGPNGWETRTTQHHATAARDGTDADRMAVQQDEARRQSRREAEEARADRRADNDRADEAHDKKERETYARSDESGKAEARKQEEAHGVRSERAAYDPRAALDAIIRMDREERASGSREEERDHSEQPTRQTSRVYNF